MPSNVLPLHLKQTFPPIIWIFTEGEGDGIESRLPFKIFSTYFTHDFRQIEKCLQTDSTTANTNGVATGERKTLPEMGTISRKLGDDELPLSSEAADADLIGDHEDRGRTGNYILISVIS